MVSSFEVSGLNFAVPKLMHHCVCIVVFTYLSVVSFICRLIKEVLLHMVAVKLSSVVQLDRNYDQSSS